MFQTALWRANSYSSTGGWYSRVGSLPSFSRGDRAHGGSNMAMLLCIQNAWDEWLTVKGLGKDACPIEGMWDIVDPSAA